MHHHVSIGRLLIRLGERCSWLWGRAVSDVVPVALDTVGVGLTRGSVPSTHPPSAMYPVMVGWNGSPDTQEVACIDESIGDF